MRVCQPRRAARHSCPARSSPASSTRQAIRLIPPSPTGATIIPPGRLSRTPSPSWKADRRSAFASGMAAIAAVFGPVLRPGDILALPSDSYFTTRILASDYLAQMGVQVRLAPTANNAQMQTMPGARLLFIETPSNPDLDVCDIALLCEAAHRQGALVAVDNTTPTMLGQNPAGTRGRFLAGSRYQSPGRSFRPAARACSGPRSGAGRKAPMVAQAHRRHPGTDGGVAGAPLARHTGACAWSEHAKTPCRLQRFLAERGMLSRCATRGWQAIHLMPSLPARCNFRSDRQLHPARPPERGDFPDFVQAGVRSHQLRQRAHQRRAAGALGGDAVPEGFIRLSAGIEDARDLLADLSQALDRAA